MNSCTDPIPTAFDRARQEMLAAFLPLAKEHPEAAQIEIQATMDALQSLLVLEAGAA